MTHGRDVVRVRRAVASRTTALGFSLLDSTRMMTAASELARNMLSYAGGGEVHLEEVSEGARHGLRATFLDYGPGIADIEQALSDGFTTSRGLGLGLGGARRLVDDFEIRSIPGAGTAISIVRWR